MLILESLIDSLSPNRVSQDELSLKKDTVRTLSFHFYSVTERETPHWDECLVVKDDFIPAFYYSTVALLSGCQSSGSLPFSLLNLTGSIQ